GEVDHQLHLIFGEDPLQDGPIEDRAGDLAIDLRRDGCVERAHVERDDRVLLLARKAVDQAVTDLAAGARDENDRFTHAVIILFACAPSCCWCCASSRPRASRRPTIATSPATRCVWTTSIRAGHVPARPSRSMAW